MDEDQACFGAMDDEIGLSTTPGSEPGASSEHYLAPTDSLEELEIDAKSEHSSHKSNQGAIKQLILDEKRKRTSQCSDLSGNESSASPNVSESESDYLDSQEIGAIKGDSKMVGE